MGCAALMGMCATKLPLGQLKLISSPMECSMAISPAPMGCMGPQDTQPQERTGRTTRNAHLVLTGGLPTADMQFRPQKEAI